MPYQLMNTSLKRLIGAQFRKHLNGEILVFRYPFPTTRLFHTMWCPPIRIVVLEADTPDARVVFDRIVEPWHFVSLPAGKLILEMDPETDYQSVISEIIETSKEMPLLADDLPIGGIDSSVSISHVLLQMCVDSLSALRSVKATCLNESGQIDPVRLVHRYTPWERGKIFASAGFVLDDRFHRTWTIPRSAIPLSRAILKYENEFADELLAAMHGAIPSWRTELRAACLGCGGGGSWRPVMPMDPVLPVEISWRLMRPENSFPMCNRCAARFKVVKNENIRYELGSSFWGARFAALEKWYQGVLGTNGSLLHGWDKGSYPLWPQAYGGETWETGSGAVKHVDAQWPLNVQRRPEQIDYLKHAGVYTVVQKYPFQSLGPAEQ